jgi:hypothetical protein
MKKIFFSAVFEAREPALTAFERVIITVIP